MNLKDTPTESRHFKDAAVMLCVLCLLLPLLLLLMALAICMFTAIFSS